MLDFVEEKKKLNLFPPEFLLEVDNEYLIMLGKLLWVITIIYKENPIMNYLPFLLFKKIAVNDFEFSTLGNDSQKS